jgi:hypothetical protein
MNKRFLLTFLFLATCAISRADCTLQFNCGLCNSGQFTVHCECHNGSNWECSGCYGTCTQGGCCCGHTTHAPVMSYCSTIGCGFTPHCFGQLKSPYLLASTAPSLAGLALAPADIPIDVDVPPEAGIEITDTKLNITPTHFSGGAFTIRNTNNKNLIAYSVSMFLYFEGGGKPLKMATTADGWFLDQYVLKPDESREASITLSVDSNGPVKLTRVLVRPDYVEFAGGDAPLAASDVAASVKASRNTKMTVLRSYCAQLAAGASAADIASSLKTAPKSQSTELSRGILSSYLANFGIERLAAVCNASPQPRAF